MGRRSPPEKTILRVQQLKRLREAFIHIRTLYSTDQHSKILPFLNSLSVIDHDLLIERKIINRILTKLEKNTNQSWEKKRKELRFRDLAGVNLITRSISEINIIETL